MQRIIVFQQGGSGEEKIGGVRRYGRDVAITRIVSIDAPLPPIVDDPERYFEDSYDADVVLCFLKHPDLAHELALRCHRQGIPIVASGQRIPVEGVMTPPT